MRKRPETKGGESKLIAFTGGGSSGHVNPSLPIISEFRRDNWEVLYIGSESGPEKEICARIHGVTYMAIKTERLRRFRTPTNILMPFKVIIGMAQSFIILRAARPAILFSKGGFVSVPVVIAAWFLRIPVISHESDLSPGLATKINKKFSDFVFLTFPFSFYDGDWVDRNKMIPSGIPIRDSFCNIAPNAVLAILGKPLAKPLILVFGGSSGAAAINQAVRKALPQLLSSYTIAHLVGRGNIDPQLQTLDDYFQFEYLHEGIESLMSASEIIICRAGMTSIIELIYLKKPAILIPLSKKVSRGDQLQNAKKMSSLGICIELSEEQLDAGDLLAAVSEYKERLPDMGKAMSNLGINFSADAIKEQILTCIGRI
jgi:UDP-N-acetylglucosamine--N-acetylmuramyl-(pentapeptide) pyrophosphoryl-undecaprenol N-acetylglucosamine transferase